MDILADAKDFSILDFEPIPLIEPGDVKDINGDLLLKGEL